jgi:hypothetical protein
MIVLKENENEERKKYLVRLAIAYIVAHTDYAGIDDSLFYDNAECDGYCLAEDLRSEFDIEED